MKIISLSFVVSMLVISCGINREHNCDETEPVEISYAPTSSVIEEGVPASIAGQVLDNDTGEPLFGAQVYLTELQRGVLTDLAGNFKFDSIPAGTYTIMIEFLGFKSIAKEGIVVQENEQLVIGTFSLGASVELLKPMLYFYPEDTISLTVELDYDGTLTYTYPLYEKGWQVTAHPDGSLVDENGRGYYGLFWEGETELNKTVSDGFVVERSETISFLEEKLSLLGLNDHEANEFIVFWLPVLNKNKRNFIHFDTSYYTEHAMLNITPKPATTIRLLMLHMPIEDEINVPEQTFATMPQRNGFTVVEWGGKAMTAAQIVLN